jgi:hypothetical protein
VLCFCVVRLDKMQNPEKYANIPKIPQINLIGATRVIDPSTLTPPPTPQRAISPSPSPQPPEPEDYDVETDPDNVVIRGQPSRSPSPDVDSL